MLRRFMDGRPNPLIGPAAAEIARHCRVDILVAGIFILLEKCDCLHDLAGLAVAALRHPDFHPCLLHGMYGRDSFYGSDLGAADLCHASWAGAYGCAILMHGTRAAQSHTAAELRPCELSHVAQIPKQRHFGIAAKRLLFSVHFETERGR